MNMEGYSAPQVEKKEDNENLKKNFLNKKKEKKEKKTNNNAEISNQVIIEKLDSLGVNYKHSVSGSGEPEYTFLNVSEEGRGVFCLDAQGKRVIFQTLHFDGNNFRHPDNKNNAISSEDLLTYTDEKFPDADEIIYSCCNPEDARKKPNNHIIIGSGFSEYQTVHNSRNHSITVSPSS